MCISARNDMCAVRILVNDSLDIIPNISVRPADPQTHSSGMVAEEESDVLFFDAGLTWLGFTDKNITFRAYSLKIFSETDGLGYDVLERGRVANLR